MFWKVITRFVSLLILPLFLLQQMQLPAALPFQDHKLQCKPWKMDPSSGFTFDDFMTFFEHLEDGSLEERCSDEELVSIMHFLVQLARKGIRKDDYVGKAVLEQSIEGLLEVFEDEVESDFYFAIDQEDYTLRAAVNCNHPIIVYCKHHRHKHHHKGWWHKRWDKVKDFYKEYKTECIVGGIVFAAVTVIVVCVTAGTAAPAIAALGAAAGTESPSDSRNDFYETTHTAEVVEEKVEALQEATSLELGYLPGEDSASFVVKVKEVGSHIAHEVWNDVSEIVSVVPDTLQEIGDVTSKFILGSSGLEGSPNKNFDSLVASGHELIDHVFDTDQAQAYAGENSHGDKFSYGILPLPGTFARIFVDTGKLAEAGKVIDKADFTKAGRGLMKHGYREGSVYPKPMGDPAQVNEQGQKILESFLNHPENVVYETTHPRFGKVIEVVVPGKGGVRFTSDGEMIGFLEPGKHNNG